VTLLRVGSRQSPLAIIQTESVSKMIREARPDVTLEVRLYATSGDLEQDTPIEQLERSAFTDSIERALIDGEIDIAVHSFKDLSEQGSAELVVGAVPTRADARDALVTRDGSGLAQLQSGAVVGVSSERRAAALLALRPDLVLRPIRGAVDARVAKVDAGLYDATVLAVAGLDRLGLSSRIAEVFPVEVFPPAPGQGALAVQCRRSDGAVLEILGEIDDRGLRAEVHGEYSLQQSGSGV
jgi:hydroxymethylbilane synthase